MIENGKYRFTEDCDRVAEVLRRVGDKWSVLIVVLLEMGPRRFNDLKRSIPGISQRAHADIAQPGARRTG